MRHLLLALPFALLPLAAAQANEHSHEHQHEHGSLDAHEHGVASLSVVHDGRVLELHLESPAMNLVGFEHKAKSDADKAKVAAAKATLEQPLPLFALAAGACKASETELQSPLFAAAAHEHKHEHDAAEHSEIHAHYRFDCAQADALKQLDLSELFKRFPATEKIQVQLIGPSGQQGAELSAAQPRLNF